MKQIVAVDPGLNACGLSVFNEDSRLEHAELVENEREAALDLPTRWEGMALAVGARVARISHRFAHVDRTVVVEMPKVYPSARQVGDQNDLMNLVGVVASIVNLGLSDRRRLLYPRDWKGTLDADDMIERIQGRLSAEETKRVRLPGAASKAHNVWDAVGIGLYVVGRLEARKVIAR